MSLLDKNNANMPVPKLTYKTNVVHLQPAIVTDSSIPISLDKRVITIETIYEKLENIVNTINRLNHDVSDIYNDISILDIKNNDDLIINDLEIKNVEIVDKINVSDIHDLEIFEKNVELEKQPKKQRRNKKVPA
jgi:hypothetical protein